MTNFLFCTLQGSSQVSDTGSTIPLKSTKAEEIDHQGLFIENSYLDDDLLHKWIILLSERPNTSEYERMNNWLHRVISLSDTWVNMKKPTSLARR